MCAVNIKVGYPGCPISVAGPSSSHTVARASHINAFGLLLVSNYQDEHLSPSAVIIILITLRVLDWVTRGVVIHQDTHYRA